MLVLLKMKHEVKNSKSVEWENIVISFQANHFQ